MPLFGHSDEELAKREDEVQRKYSDIKNLLQKQQNEIAARFQDLGNVDASIMTRSNLETIYQQQLATLDTQKKSLETIIASYQAAAQKFVDKEKNLATREQTVLAQECDAKARFASQLDAQMQPLNAYKAELENKSQRIILMQEEFNKNFVAQDQKLLADFQKLKEELQASFAQLQQSALAERERLAQQETALNNRDAELAKRESELKQGLASERSKIFSDLEAEKVKLAATAQELKNQAAALLVRKQELDKQDAALADRTAAVQARESEAASGFAQQKQSMLAEVQASREAGAANLVALQQQATEQCDKLLQEWNAMLGVQRTQMLESFTKELGKQRETFAASQSALEKRQGDMDAAATALSLREARVKAAEEANRQQAEFLVEKEKLMSEKFQKIAAESIAAAQAEAQAAHASRDELAAKLAAANMQMEAMKAAPAPAAKPAAPAV